ncbi:hypothetical protein [Ammoniphilus sp. YIM 78166]|uniref:hypothetical protein n=1 Tax=Ammoniphilus sp. YIM 78166 TaxID=1644106 RepID=UPI00106FB64A|nr:hypothetical protein [Ammoniphilus sp. YIM 78166]
MKNSNWVLYLIGILVLWAGIRYAQIMPLISEKEALGITSKYVSEEFVLNNTNLIDIRNENHVNNWDIRVKKYESFSGRYLWRIVYYDSENKIDASEASFVIDGRTGTLLEGKILDIKTGRMESNFVKQ